MSTKNEQEKNSFELLKRIAEIKKEIKELETNINISSGMIYSYNNSQKKFNIIQKLKQNRKIKEINKIIYNDKNKLKYDNDLFNSFINEFVNSLKNKKEIISDEMVNYFFEHYFGDVDKLIFEDSSLITILINNLSDDNLEKFSIIESNYLKSKHENIYDYYLKIINNKRYKDDSIINLLSIQKDKINLIINKDNIINIIESYKDLFKLLYFVSNNKNYIKDSEYIIGKIKEKIELEPQKYVSNYLNIDDISYLIIKEISENENKSITDLKRISQGAFSQVYELGDKIIKIGVRNVDTFNDNPYIIAPLIRKVIDIDEYNDKSRYIEVEEKVDTETDVTEEQLYQLYKNLRNLGLIWTDIKKENVGYLLKDNVMHWKKDISDTPEARSLKEKRGDTILKKGDLVIIDADWIFDESNYKIPSQSSYVEINNKFDDRYKKEKDIISKDNYNMNIIEEESQKRRL